MTAKEYARELLRLDKLGDPDVVLDHIYRHSLDYEGEVPDELELSVRTVIRWALVAADQEKVLRLRERWNQWYMEKLQRERATQGAVVPGTRGLEETTSPLGVPDRPKREWWQSK